MIVELHNKKVSLSHIFSSKHSVFSAGGGPAKFGQAAWGELLFYLILGGDH